jgi:nicotinamidase-related amidase
MIANILNPMQVAMLKDAAKTPVGTEPGVNLRTEAVNKITDLIKRQNPEKFFHTIEDRPDPELRNRVFFNEPRNLQPYEYAGYKVQYVSKVTNKA